MTKMIIDGPHDLPPELLQAAAELGLEVERGEIRECATCGFFSCACEIKKQHKEGCPYLRAATSSVGISCEPHDRDVCPVCDACTCGGRP